MCVSYGSCQSKSVLDLASNWREILETASCNILQLYLKLKNVQERRTRNGYSNQEPKDTSQDAEKRSAWWLPLQIRNAVMVLYPLMIRAER